MEKTNLENLNKLAKLFGTDRLISPEEIQEIRGVLVGVLANNKKELESLTAETRELVNKVLNKVLDEHDTYLEKSKQIVQEAKSDTTEAIQATMKSLEEVKKLCKEVMDCKPENGKDADEEYVIGEVLNRIKLPEYKEVVLDDGGAIVDKINSLPVNEENQIDAKHIKNLPEMKGGRVISGGVTRKIVEQMIAAAGGGTPGGSTTQLQYNNAGAFGGISGATTNGTAVTYTAGSLIAADITASGSGGLLLQSNNGTDALLIGAGGGSNATFYGGVNIAGELTVDTNTLYVDPTNNRVGIKTTTPSQALEVNGTISLAGGGGFEIFATAGSGGEIQTYSSLPLLLNRQGNGVGIRTTSATHSLTLGSSSTGIALYNTADQTTNYERGLISWASNILTIATGLGGTGIARAVRLTAVGSGSNGTFTVNRGALPLFEFSGGSTATTSGNIIDAVYTNTASSGTITMMRIAPTINQSSTAGYTALLVNPTETTTGSGTKLLADFQVGGTSRFSISNEGETTITRQVTGNYIPLTLTNSSTAIGDNVVISMRPANLSTGRAQIHAIAPGGSDVELAFYTSNNNASPTEKVRIDDIGNVGIGQNAPTAYLHIKAGAAAAESAPLKLTSGTNLTTPENGAVEYDGTNFYATPSGAIRQTVDLFYNNALTATSNAATVPVAYKMTTVTNNSAATLTITITTSGAVDGQLLMVRIKDFSAVAQTITWVNTENSTVSAPTTSNGSTTLPLTVGFQYNSATSKWRCVASC